MRGQTASLVTAAERGQPDDLGLVERLLSYGGDTIPAGRRMVATSEPWQIVKGANRAEAVAMHLYTANRELVGQWDARYISDPSKAAFQAGAAATETMANVLLALVDGNVRGARRLIEQFVNDAVDTGVVAV